MNYMIILVIYSKTTAENESKRKDIQENPFIVLPNKKKPPGGRKGKQFGQRIKRKSQSPTILTLQDEIEEKIESQSKIRNKRQVINMY